MCMMSSLKVSHCSQHNSNDTLGKRHKTKTQSRARQASHFPRASYEVSFSSFQSSKNLPLVPICFLERDCI